MRAETDPTRTHGWLPPPGPQHARAVVSIALFLLVYVSQGFGFARLTVVDRSPNESFSYEGTISVEGGGGHSLSLSESLRAQLAYERAMNIEGDMSGYGVLILAGLFLSGRPRWGAKVGIAAGVLGLLSLIGARAQVTSDFRQTDWPFPVDARLEFGWGFWISCAALAVAVVWNIVRIRLDRRASDTETGVEVSGARS